MEVLLLSFSILFFLIILVKSAELVEGAFVFLARKIRVSEFFIGFVVLSIITSLPEISISILSSQEEFTQQLSVGNLIGATTVLLTLVIGLSAVKYGHLEFKGKFSEKEVLIGLGIITSMLVVILDQYISVAEGVILLGSYFAYVIYLNRKFNAGHLRKHAFLNLKKLYHSIIKAGIGVILLLISSSMIVRNATDLANILTISPAIIGILLLAVGTNLPEITILAISRKTANDEKLALGNFFGSACVNPGILGLLTVLAGGVKITSFIALIPSIVILFFTIILFFVATWTGRKVTRLEGILLASLYFSLLISELIIIINS